MDVYSYVPNAAMGHSPKLDQINQTAIGVLTSFAYDAAGNQTQATEGVQVTNYAYDDASRLSRIERLSDDAASDLAYDGRSFLRRAEATSISVLFESGFESGGSACWDNTIPGPPTGTCPPKPITGPTYSSDGVLHHVAKSDSTEQRVIVYLAGRPVAIVSVDAVGTPTYTYLTADHLGTPVLATDAAGVALWDGGFEPFGADYDGASGAGMFLRFPGQWVDETWDDEEAYNVHRWYSSNIGGYLRPDPAAVDRSLSTYLFGSGRPTRYYDPLGLYTIDGSCTCPAVDPPFSPTSPAETPVGLNVADLQRGVDEWCGQGVLNEISDPKLRDCIQTSCDVGQIKCKDDCDVDKMVGLNIKIPLFKNRVARVCTNAPPWHLTSQDLGNTVIHEWAHGCGWDHGDGSGVPDDPE